MMQTKDYPSFRTVRAPKIHLNFGMRTSDPESTKRRLPPGAMDPGSEAGMTVTAMQEAAS